MYEMRIKEQIVDLTRLVPNPWNHNEQSDFMQAKLGKSLDKFGQIAEIIVREKPDGQLEIIDGEHRWKELAAKGVLKALVNNLGTVSEDDARLITVVMNELRGDRNPTKLSRLLKSLRASADWSDIVDVLPFNPVEMENILLLADDAPPLPKEKTDGDGAKASGWVDIRVAIHQDDMPEVKAMMERAKATLGIVKEPDAALENGKLLKVLLNHGGEHETT